VMLGITTSSNPLHLGHIIVNGSGSYVYPHCMHLRRTPSLNILLVTASFKLPMFPRGSPQLYYLRSAV
ncbi:MAG: hypothetical protein QXV28_05225, partial [Ignisphaera sp.]